MSSRILYMVAATLPDEATAREYIAWLEDGHIDQIVGAGAEGGEVSGGAHSGMIVRIDTPPGERPRVETHYVFSTRENYDRYIASRAPALRAEGLKRFPPERGIVFERRVGEIV